MGYQSEVFCVLKIIRTIKYRNGKVEASTTLRGISLVAFREGVVVDTRCLPLDMLDNKKLLETMIGFQKSDVGLILQEDDTTLVINKDIRYLIRGNAHVVLVLYRKETSNFYQNRYLPYSYDLLSFQDYQKIFS